MDQGLSPGAHQSNGIWILHGRQKVTQSDSPGSDSQLRAIREASGLLYCIVVYGVYIGVDTRGGEGAQKFILICEIWNFFSRKNAPPLVKS